MPDRGKLGQAYLDAQRAWRESKSRYDWYSRNAALAALKRAYRELTGETLWLRDAARVAKEWAAESGHS